MQPFQKAEQIKVIDLWLVTLAGIALGVSAGLSWISKGRVSLFEISLLIVVAGLIACSIFLRKLDWGFAVAIQVAVGMQILSALFFEQRPALIGGLMAIVALPAMLWLSLIRRRLFRILDFGGYFLVFSGLILSCFSPVSKGTIPFAFGASDYFLLGTVAASLVIGQMLRERIFHRDTILTAVGLSGTILVFVAIIQDFFGSGGELFGNRLGLSAIIGPNLLAFCLDISLPITLGIALDQNVRSKRGLYFLFGCVQLLALIMTGTRGSIVTLAAVLIWITFRARKLKYFWVVTPPIFALITFEIIKKTISRLVSSSPEELLSHLGRLTLIRSAWNMLSQNYYLWGIGVDRFSSLKFEYGFPIWFNPTKSMSTHNTYLEYWLGWGLVGLLGYIFVVGRALLPKLGTKSNHATTGLRIAILGIAVHGFVDSALVAYSFTFTFWVILACSIFGEASQENAHPIK